MSMSASERAQERVLDDLDAGHANGTHDGPVPHCPRCWWFCPNCGQRWTYITDPRGESCEECEADALLVENEPR